MIREIAERFHNKNQSCRMFKNKNSNRSKPRNFQRFSPKSHLELHLQLNLIEMNSLFTSSRILITSDTCKKLISGGILVSNNDGRIEKIFTSQEEINSWMFLEHGSEVFDYGDNIIMPGLIDANVNCSSGTDLEDFTSITKAAAAGGYTTIVDNPFHSIPATTNICNLRTKVEQARKNCLHVDMAFWGGVTGDNNENLLSLANNGVCGFKGFLNPQESNSEFQYLTRDKLKSALEILEETDCVFAIKPEIELKEPILHDNANVKEYETFLNTKPHSIEKNGVDMVIEMIKDHKMKIHLTDISSAECLPLIQKYQSQKNPKISKLTFETSLHYLSLISEEVANCKTEFKCSPPIRNMSNRNKLLQSMKCYEIYNVSSSQMPSSIGTKCLIGGKNRGNFIEASYGISGSLQFGLSIFWSIFEKNMSLYDLNRYMSYHPAKLCGLEKNKGIIAVGYDADFCIWNPDESITICKDDIFLKNKLCPYIGKTLKGKVCATVVRGCIVYDGKNQSFDAPIGNVLLKKPSKRSCRTITFETAG